MAGDVRGDTDGRGVGLGKLDVLVGVRERGLYLVVRRVRPAEVEDDLRGGARQADGLRQRFDRLGVPAGLLEQDAELVVELGDLGRGLDLVVGTEP